MLALFRSAVAAGRDRPFLRYFDTVLSYGDVDRISDALASALADGGFSRGDRIALYLQNIPQYVFCLLAAWKAGGVAVAVNPMLTAREVKKLITDSTPTVFIALDELQTPELLGALVNSSVQRFITTSALDWQSDNDARILPAARLPVPAGTQDLSGKILRRQLRDKDVGDHEDALATQQPRPWR